MCTGYLLLALFATLGLAAMIAASPILFELFDGSALRMQQTPRLLDTAGCVPNSARFSAASHFPTIGIHSKETEL
ncbi:MAG TPA: hypothetical protein VK638_17510 [Edaphobacter sp.]|nr:hypothetical protein [Edaphobacter sp.]